MGNGTLSARLQTFSAELRQLEKELKEARETKQVDPLVIRDFRESVDNVRLTAWTLQLWLEEQAKDRDPYALLNQLTTERIRRAKELSQNLTGDLDAFEVTVEHESLKELFVTLEPLYKRLAHVFGGA
jgi:hypothetical protein